jgi:2-aminoadipate transaminase
MENRPHLFANRTETMGASAIREILKVVSRPGMISLAGGIPSPDSFPMPLIEKITLTVLDKYGSGAFQYGLTEGFLPLRKALVHHLAKKGIASTAEDILISSGSQGVLDNLGKILINPNDRIALEAPTYLGALQAFTPYEPEYIEIETDNEGILPDALEKALSQQTIKFIYLVPNFQNPTGRTLPLPRRQAIADIVQRYDTLLIEDDPYGDLRYRGETIPAIKTMAPEHVVYISTLSKVFAPGLRIGFCLAPTSVKNWLVLAKQGVDLHTSTFNQAMAAEYLSGGHLDRHLPSIIELYRPRQQVMLDTMSRYFPTAFNWTKPEGGMFVWVEGPKGMDMEAVYQSAVVHNTAFVPGTFFFAEKGKGKETMRLNYTMVDERSLTHAVRTLGEVLYDALDKRQKGMPSGPSCSSMASHRC